MKIIGSLLIIIASIVTSFFYENKLKNQSVQLKEINKFIVHIKNNIEFFSLSLNDIYKKYNSNNELIYMLISKKQLDFFDSEIEDELTNTFSGLGCGFKDEQIKKLEYLHTFLNEKIKDFDENYTKKTKVFRAMSLFLGCCAIILLV